MKIAFGLGHPAHFHLFKKTIEILSEKHQVILLISQKDILINLVKSSGFHFELLLSKNYGTSLVNKAVKAVNSTFTTFKHLNTFDPDIIITCLPQLIWVGRLKGIPSFFVGEDDYAITKIQGKITYPFVSGVLMPTVTDIGPYKNKKISYNGYQKLAYLHPQYFSPDRSKVDIPLGEKYFILRFSSLNAYHDINANGLSDILANKILSCLSQYGKVIISSERDLPEGLNEYRFKGNLEDIHHYMAFAEMFIGDSQSMCAEAGLLGTPFIRYNNFVGKIGYLNEIENKYHLGFGIKNGNEELLIQKIMDLLNTPGLKNIFLGRMQNMLEEKIDVTRFYVWFIENYPESKVIMKNKPDYQNNFK
jgi:predicted glycosyltransferase